jgi:hypothetical protein
MNGKWGAPVDGDTLNLNSGYVKVSYHSAPKLGLDDATSLSTHSPARQKNVDDLRLKF